MKVVITSATEKELMLVKQAVHSLQLNDDVLQLTYHVSGVGMLATCFSLTRLIYEQKPEFIIQAGLAGCFRQKHFGKVVTVKYELLADCGVTENDVFYDIFDIHLTNENEFPFVNKKLYNLFLQSFDLTNLEQVVGVTINEISTNENRIAQMMNRYRADVESMEGAALHYCCLQTNVPFIQIRSISNYVGERDKTKWDFDGSLNNLSKAVAEYVWKLYERFQTNHSL